MPYVWGMESKYACLSWSCSKVFWEGKNFYAKSFIRDLKKSICPMDDKYNDLGKQPQTKTFRGLHVIHSLSGGGAERQMQILVNESVCLGLDVHVFCVDDKGCQLNLDSVSLYR